MVKRRRLKRRRLKETGKSKKNLTLMFVMIALFIGSGLSYAIIMGRTGNINDDLQPSVPLPDFAYKNQKTLATYAIATNIPEVLEKIPCYCGCGMIGHKNLRNCYINDDGSFADHAVYCDMCMDEALDVNEWYQQDLPIKEIRSRIDAKYGGGNAQGTPTPPA